MARTEQWPSVGRIVHLRHPAAADRCQPAIITGIEGKQPADVIDVQGFPVNHLGPEMQVAREGAKAEARDAYSGWTWHFPEYVGPAAE